MYNITHRLKNIVNHHYFTFYRHSIPLLRGIYRINLRFNGTLHWKCVNNPNELRNLSCIVINEAKKTLTNTFNRPNPTAVDLLYGVDHVSNMLCLLADPAELVRNIHPELEWRIAADSVVNEVSMFIEEVNMDRRCYEILMNAVNESGNLTFEQQKVLSHMISSMRDHGVHLTELEKNEYISLILKERELSQILTDSKHKYIKIPTKLIPSNYINPSDLHHSELLVDSTMGNHLLRSTHDEKKRKTIYSYIMEKSEILDQSLLKLTQTRHRMAKLRQFSNYSSLALRDNILSTPFQVDKYLSNILDAVNSSLLDELNLISGNLSQVNSWDLDYLISQHEAKHADQTFSFTSLMGLFQKIVKCLFDIELVESKAKGHWTDLIKYYFVKDGVKLCTLYLDIFNREEKSGIFAQFTLKCSKSLSNSHCFDELTTFINRHFDLTDGQNIQFQTPSTAVVCNFPYNSNELNLDLNQTIMLFHELGHTLHTLLSYTTYQHLSGNRGGVDFAEFSSHLFEFYPRKLLPSAPKTTLKSIEFTKIAILAIADQIVYSSEWHDFNDLENKLRDKLLQYPALNQQFKGNLVLDIFGLPNLSKFDHLVHYGGTYYCYLYSRSLAGMVWDLFGKGNEYSTNFGIQLQKFFNQGSIDSSIKPIIDICNGDSQLIKHPENIDSKYIFV